MSIDIKMTCVFQSDPFITHAYFLLLRQFDLPCVNHYAALNQGNELPPNSFTIFRVIIWFRCPPNAQYVIVVSEQV